MYRVFNRLYTSYFKVFHICAYSCGAASDLQSYPSSASKPESYVLAWQSLRTALLLVSLYFHVR